MLNTLFHRNDKRDESSHPTSCSCAACRLLECLDRPRYFPGMLLSDVELNSEMGYVLAKNRLHNRFLHGYGVVCGLKVTCHDCEGWVQVEPGYALDPCGNDIIVCKPKPVNVVELIRKCRESDRRRRKLDCDPIRPDETRDCKDVTETWCLTLEYDEKEARPVTALRRDPGKTCGSCGCNGIKSQPCGCECHSRRASTVSCATSSPVTHGAGKTVSPCEPTRIFEDYKLDACRAKKRPCADLSELMDVSLLAKIISCFQRFLKISDGRFTDNTGILLITLALAQNHKVTVPAATQYDAVCRLYNLIRDLIVDHPQVRCQLIDLLNQVTVPPPNNDDAPTIYHAKVQPALYHLGALALQIILDCICLELLPPCPDNPEDDRLIIACITIRNDKILRICNFSCRKYAGGFPAMLHWLSIIPVLPAIGALVENLCCSDGLLYARSPLTNVLADFLERIDPTGSMRDSLAEGDFAIPKMYASEARKISERVRLTNVSERLRPEGLNLATLREQPAGRAVSAIRTAGATVEERSVASEAELPRFKMKRPFARAGDHVVVYRLEGRVAGFEVTPSAAGAPAADEVAALRSEIATLRSEVETLKTTSRRGPGR